MKTVLHRSRTLLLALMLLSLMTRSLFPAGYMPAQDADGLFKIVICTATGPATVLVGAEYAPGEQAPPHDGDSSHAPCPYAPVLAQDVAPPVPALLPPFPREKDMRVVIAALNLSARLAKPWLSQGPPVFS